MECDGYVAVTLRRDERRKSLARISNNGRPDVGRVFREIRNVEARRWKPTQPVHLGGLDPCLNNWVAVVGQSAAKETTERQYSIDNRFPAKPRGFTRASLQPRPPGQEGCEVVAPRFATTACPDQRFSLGHCDQEVESDNRNDDQPRDTAGFR